MSSRWRFEWMLLNVEKRSHKKQHLEILTVNRTIAEKS